MGMGWLTRDGAVAAALVGITVFAGAGLPGELLLFVFFLSGSFLTALNHKAGLGDPDAPKMARNARQVLANGLWAAAGAALVPWKPAAGWAILTGSLAAAQSDTWATEVGARVSNPPRSITTGRPVPRGTSGGITALGTAGGIAGAFALSGAAAAAGVPTRAALTGFLGGIAGMVTDSLLGATAQARFFCDTCKEPTERRHHRCGRESRLTGGWKWLDNDAVNLLATGAGASTAVLLSYWL
jgi:uncharacterized protein (TIGR00297 family)